MEALTQLGGQTWPENDAQAAWSILACHHAATETVSGESRKLEIRAKLAQPGTVSDGTRRVIVTHCPAWRWIKVELGWDTLAEIDQRDYFQRPNDLALAVLRAIEARSDAGPTGLLQPALPAEGMAAPTQLEKLEHRTKGKIQPKARQRPADHGLFDLGARDQAELF